MCEGILTAKGVLNLLTALVVASPADALTFTVRQADNVRFILADGDIESGDTGRLQTILDDGESTRLIALNSPGGDLHEGLRLGYLLRSKDFETYLPSSAVCLSSCFFVYIAGSPRDIGEGSQLGVHQFYSISDDRTAKEAEAGAQSVVSELVSYVFEMKVSPAAILRALETPAGQMHIFSAYELTAYNLTETLHQKAEPCPWPPEFVIHDTLNLYPQCPNRTR